MRLALGIVWLAPMLVAQPPDFTKKLDDERAIVHALSRLTFGPRPGDAAAVAHIGLRAWIDAQLHPEQTAESKRLMAELGAIQTLGLTPSAFVQTLALAPGETAMQRMRPLMDRLSQATTFTVGPNKNIVVSIPTDDEYLSVLQPDRKFTIGLREAKAWRALYSERQLEEVLTDFWFNHFNVDSDKESVRLQQPSYEAAIRPLVLGRFEDLLLAVATHPAMLFYLDNYASTAGVDFYELPRTERLTPTGPLIQGRLVRVTGLNENYARELLELHTLGVDGGYTQADVIAVARCFTGWTIHKPADGSVPLDAEFEFVPAIHDTGEKIVLGHTIEAGGGESDGLAVLDILAHHPATARHIARQLAQKFVADEPPQTLVERMAAAFLSSDGDLRTVLQTMIDSPEFFSEGAWRGKTKSPLEFVASAMRATNAIVTQTDPLIRRVTDMGEKLYSKPEPTGYPLTGEAWMNTSSMVARLNFGSTLAEGQIVGSFPDIDSLRGKPVADIARDILGSAPSAALAEALASVKTESAAVALTIGSPDFQRR